ncbi:MAG: sigma-70 family RNA polymerase sigma factor [Lachnospiraceae bacterium]
MLKYNKPLDENEKAFVEMLWNEYKPIMYSTALKYSQDSHQVQDIIQNSVEKIIHKASVLISLDRCALVTYIVLIVRSTAINYLKRAGLELRLFVEDCDSIINDIPDQMVSTENIIIDHETSANIQELLVKLSINDRLVLEGKYIIGLSDGELAKICGINKNSVRMRLSRARVHAKYILESEDYDYGKIR